MSHIIYLSLKGKKQGLISAGCSTPESIGNRYQKGREDQIQVLSLNHSMSRDQNVNHQPVSFVKPIDKSSPLFAGCQFCALQDKPDGTTGVLL
ncbi:protein of unknown function [Xenorhabdus nematophila AN6/1]|nr:hypothetical protein XNA1_1160004 [Xenorhabdus nematophila str. Anatoliense]CEE93911.1 hypothetical protein XNA1_4440004 [Xenorhabdus nematophila str. Anatoliense]CEF30449.1 hypothetical protein XNW1_2520005 [Xenorhabdus nematophila str. Websteri]CEF34268.1 hypothetical protein XNW1_910005 [Xenorhabdus nematophila str. Websteri]CEK23473.1 protein of unknown function [Xenorhabdus nematophila AN6/1]